MIWQETLAMPLAEAERKIAILTAKLQKAAEQAFISEVVQTQMLEIELANLPGVSAEEYKADWIEEWLGAL
jgi:hypothetical protein